MQQIASSTKIKRHCDICGFEENCDPIASMTDNYVAVRCSNCHVMTVDPLPSLEQLKEYYSNYNPTKDTPERLSTLVNLHQKIFQYLISKIEVKHKKMSFLDYGFGSGAFLKQVTKQGHIAYGIEFSRQNCEQIENYNRENNDDIKILQIPQESMAVWSDKKFDCITLFQVIEHLQDPIDSLKKLSSFQNTGGIIYLECPNDNALYLKIKNLIRNYVGREAFFNSLNPPQHIYGFNKKSMKILLEQAGYTPININDYYLGDALHQLETLFWYPSFQKFISDKSRWNFYGISKFLIGLLDPLASKIFGSGGGLYALARKK